MAHEFEDMAMRFARRALMSTEHGHGLPQTKKPFRVVMTEVGEAVFRFFFRQSRGVGLFQYLMVCILMVAILGVIIDKVWQCMPWSSRVFLSNYNLCNCFQAPLVMVVVALGTMVCVCLSTGNETAAKLCTLWLGMFVGYLDAVDASTWSGSLTGLCCSCFVCF